MKEVNNMQGKGNDGSGNIPERDLWETEEHFFHILDSQYMFTFDCCANAQNTKCQKYTNDFLNWFIPQKMCWMNPPFSKASDMFEHFFKITEKGVAIFRCDNLETKVWQEQILPFCDWVFIPKGRISYTPFKTGEMRGGMGTRFPSALIGIGVEEPKELKGTLLRVPCKK